ncbi:hypothetical protein [Burkholderia pyrrocinia]|uniref:hypothetical protein n=1 Tax=Burkholderia pyrrocinia TaxID=60550 RepID=UPI001589AEBC|nr:hypothetical protein [Burkholderia pyrrocinia]
MSYTTVTFSHITGESYYGMKLPYKPAGTDGVGLGTFIRGENSKVKFQPPNDVKVLDDNGLPTIGTRIAIWLKRDTTVSQTYFNKLLYMTLSGYDNGKQILDVTDIGGNDIEELWDMVTWEGVNALETLDTYTCSVEWTISKGHIAWYVSGTDRSPVFLVGDELNGIQIAKIVLDNVTKHPVPTRCAFWHIEDDLVVALTLAGKSNEPLLLSYTRVTRNGATWTPVGSQAPRVLPPHFRVAALLQWMEGPKLEDVVLKLYDGDGNGVADPGVNVQFREGEVDLRTVTSESTDEVSLGDKEIGPPLKYDPGVVRDFWGVRRWNEQRFESTSEVEIYNSWTGTTTYKTDRQDLDLATEIMSVDLGAKGKPYTRDWETTDPTLYSDGDHTNLWHFECGRNLPGK